MLSTAPHAGVISSPKAPVSPARKIGPRGASSIRIPGAALGVPLSSLTGGNCGRAVEFLRRARFFIPLGRQLGGDAAQNFTKRLPRLRFLHAHNIGEADGQEVAKNRRGRARVRT